jgi:hypothetical protein
MTPVGPTCQYSTPTTNIGRTIKPHSLPIIRLPNTHLSHTSLALARGASAIGYHIAQPMMHAFQPSHPSDKHLHGACTHSKCIPAHIRLTWSRRRLGLGSAKVVVWGWAS